MQTHNSTFEHCTIKNASMQQFFTISKHKGCKQCWCLDVWGNGYQKKEPMSHFGNKQEQNITSHLRPTQLHVHINNGNSGTLCMRALAARMYGACIDPNFTKHSWHDFFHKQFVELKLASKYRIQSKTDGKAAWRKKGVRNVSHDAWA